MTLAQIDTILLRLEHENIQAYVDLSSSLTTIRGGHAPGNVFVLFYSKRDKLFVARRGMAKIEHPELEAVLKWVIDGYKRVHP